MEAVLYASLACRIVLNIRAVSDRSVHSEFYTAFHESPPLAIHFLPLNHNTSAGSSGDEDQSRSPDPVPRRTTDAIAECLEPIDMISRQPYDLLEIVNK
jgi:hypothetical protein